MSRSAAATVAGRAEHERAHDRHQRQQRPRMAAVPSRRVSGPASRRPSRAAAGDPRAFAVGRDGTLAPAYPAGPAAPRVRTPSRPPLRLAAGGAAITLRVAETAMAVSGSRWMDRLVRSRAWVVIIGVALIGVVAMQVSMLKLNAGIGRAVTTSATLDRSNSALRSEISRLSSGDRIQQLASARGFVMPEPADLTFLTAGSLRSDGFQAARAMRAPDAAIAGPAGSVTADSLAAQQAEDAAAATTTAATGTTATATDTSAGTGTTTEATGTTPPAATNAVAPPATTDQATAPATTDPTIATGAATTAPAAAQANATGGVTP